MISLYKNFNFNLGETVDMIREQVNAFARDEIAPRAEEIDPLFPPSYESLRSEALYLLGRYEEAAESLLKLPRLSVRQYVRLAGTYAQFGQRDAARDALRHAEALEPGWDHVGKMLTSYICENPADLEHMTEGVRKALAFREAC